jgi:tetratricopeptide (TPR) repeat protein
MNPAGLSAVPISSAGRRRGGGLLLRLACGTGAALLVMAAAAAESNALPEAAFSPPSPGRRPLFGGPAASLDPTNDVVGAAWRYFMTTNGAGQTAAAAGFQAQLEEARHMRLARQFSEAAITCISLIQGATPEKVQRAALLELAQIALEQENLPRAEQIYAQCYARWPKDPGVPELLLRQGIVYRKMGLPNLANSKFYSVMTTALVLKTEKMDYYRQLVQLAQNEIAQTQYELGKYEEAAGSFDRLLKSDSPPVNRSGIQYEYIHCLEAIGRPAEAIVQALDFLERFPNAAERPEVRFLCASALKQTRRDAEALRQVLALLKEQRTNAAPDAQTVAYWQRRTGNELANRFYLEGDSMKALDIYLCLAPLDSSVDWQLPVWYQIALIFERLQQPAKAIEYLDKVAGREKELPAAAPASLRAVLEMAKWRKNLLTWQTNAERVSLELSRTVSGPAPKNSNNDALSTTSAQQ